MTNDLGGVLVTGGASGLGAPSSAPSPRQAGTRSSSTATRLRTCRSTTWRSTWPTTGRPSPSPQRVLAQHPDVRAV